MSLSLKIKEHGVISITFVTLVALCLRLNYELMCLTASFNLNAK